MPVSRIAWITSTVATVLLTTALSACSEGSGPTESPTVDASPSSRSSVAPSGVGRFASPNPGSVNAYWISGPEGIVIIDSGRNKTGGRETASRIRRTGQPVAAILLTHPHPDHVGGLGALSRAFPAAPIMASAATATWMRTDPLDFYALARRDDPDFPATLTYPTKTFPPGASIEVGGLRLDTAQFGPGESETSTAYYDPENQHLFSGDLTDDRATPALLEGHTCGWLVDLAALENAFPEARTVYPGHGDPGPFHEQLREQIRYLTIFRSLVRPAAETDSPKGGKLSPGEQQSILAALARRFPGYPPVASLPDLQTYNVAAVAAEFASEDRSTLPADCQP